MISEKIEVINTLRNRLATAEDGLKEEIFSLIDKVAKMQVIERVGKFMCIMKFSEISGKIWAAEYYMWEHNAEMLKKKLKDKSGIECYEYIMNLPKSKTRLGNYEIKYYVSDWFGRYELKYPVNNEYIDKLISELK